MHNWFIQSLLPFTFAILPVVFSIGPDSLVIIRNTLSQGKKSGVAAIIGVQTGLGIHLLLALAGISFFLHTMPKLYTVLVVVGAIYLAWLGWNNIRAKTILGTTDITTHNIKDKPQSISLQLLRKSFATALLSNLINPKVVLLFITFLPGFLRLDAPISTTYQLVILVCTSILINTLWQICLVLFCTKLSTWLLSPQVSMYLGRLCGAALCTMAFFILYEHNW